MKSIFEQNGGTYTRCGDYLLPDMGLTELERMPLGKYGMMRRKYLESGRKPSGTIHEDDSERKADGTFAGD